MDPYLTSSSWLKDLLIFQYHCYKITLKGSIPKLQKAGVHDQLLMKCFILQGYISKELVTLHSCRQALQVTTSNGRDITAQWMDWWSLEIHGMGRTFDQRP
jgi:hypothetical protein